MASLISAVGEKKRFNEAIKTGWQKMFSLAWVSVLTTLAIIGGGILLIIPGIIFAIWFIFSDYVLVLDGKKGILALGESKKLVSGYWWPVFFKVFILSLITFFAGLLFIALPIVGRIFADLFLIPFSVIYGFLIYSDLKRIKGL